VSEAYFQHALKTTRLRSHMDSRAAASMYNSTSALLRQQSPARRFNAGARRASPEPPLLPHASFYQPDLNR